MSNIATYINYATIGIAAFIGVVLIFYFLKGLRRGWRYGTYRIVMFSLLFAAAFFSLKSLGEILGNIDMRSFALPPLNFSIQNGSETAVISAEWTTPYETFASVIEQCFKAYHVELDPKSITEYAFAITQSLIALLLMMVESLIIAILGNFLIMIIWHLIVKRFIKKEKRKEALKKGKLISAFEELVICGVCLAMFFAPLTSIVNTTVSSWKSMQGNDDTKGKRAIEADNSTVELINEVVDAYDTSILAKTLFNWTKNAEGKSFDVVLTEYLTTVNLGERSVGFLNELSSITKTASYAIQGGLLSEEGFKQQNIGVFLTSEYAPQMIRSIGSSSLITTVFPYAVAVAANMDSLKDYLKTDAGLEVDYTYDYAKTFDDLADLYDSVLESGACSDVLNEDNSFKKPEEIITSEFVSEHRGILEKTLATLDSESLKVFDSIVEAAVFVKCADEAKKEAEDPDSYETKILIKDFMPDFEDVDKDGNGIPDSVPASYRDIKWGDALAGIVDPLLDLMTMDSRILSTIMGAVNGNEINYNELIGITVDNFDTMVSVLCGEEASTSEVKAARQSSKGLLESPFIERAISKLLKALGGQLNTMLKTEGEFKIDFEEVLGKLLDDDMDKQTKNVTKEMRNMFGVVQELISTEAGKNFLSNLDTMPGIYFDKDGGFLGVDDDLLGSLSSALVKLDDSLIVGEVLPKAMGSFLSGDNSPVKSMNLGDIKFNFDVDNIGEELSTLVVEYSKCQELISFIMSIGTVSSSDATKASSALSGLCKYSDQLLDFLLYVADSNLINPEVDGKQNHNVAELLKKLLSPVFENASETIDDIVYSPSFDVDNELTSMVNLMKDLDKYNVVSIALSTSAATLDLSKFTSIDFSALFSNIDGSDLMSSLMGDYLDNLLFKAGGKLYIEGAEVSFKNVTSWSHEGQTMNTLVKAADEIGDITNIDFFKSDPYAIESIIKALSSSSMFTSENGYQFSKYISGMLINNIKGLDPSVSKLFADIDGVNFDELKYSIESVTKEEWADEAHLMAEMIKYLAPVKEIVSGSSVNLNNLNLTAVEKLLDCVTDSKAFGKALVPNFYKTIVDTIGDNGMEAFKNANLDYIYTASKDEIIYENSKLLNILNAAVDPVYGLVGGDGKMQKMNLSEVSAYFLINPLLKSLSESHVFNTLSDKQVLDGATMTVLEKEFSVLLGASNLFETEDKANTAILSVAKGTSTFEARKTAWDAEVDQVTIVIESIQDLGIDFDHFSLSEIFSGGKNEAKRQTLEDLLSGINDSQMLHSVLPYQINKSVDSISSSLGSSITIPEVNAYYTGFDSDGLANCYGSEEITTLSYIIEEGMTMGEIDVSNLSGSKIDDLMSLLKHLFQSNVFNTSSIATSEYDFTAAESIYYQSLNNASVYSDSNQLKAHVLNVTTGARSDLSVLSTRADSWSLEVDAIHQVFLDFDELGFSVNNFDFASLDSSKEAALASMLSDVDESTTLHSILPLKFENALGDVDSKIGGVDISGTCNTRYAGTTDLYYGEGTTVTTPNRYNDDEEFNHISRIIIRGLNIGTINTSDLTTVNADEITTIMAEMSVSHVFNSLKDGKTDTSFGLTYSTVMSTGGIASLYYSEDNPSDTSYTSAADKAKQVAKATWAPLTLSTDTTTYDTDVLNGDSNSLKSVLAYFTNSTNSSVMDVMSGDATSLEGNVIADALKKLNSCSLTTDMVPNAINKVISAPGMSLGSINIKRANPFYCYSSPYGGQYDDDEIDTITRIIDINNSLKVGGTSIFANLGSASFNSATVESMKEMLHCFDESNVFHLAGARTGSSFYDSSVASWKEEWSVFEQILGTIYDESSLSTLAYKATVDTAYASATEKLVDRMTKLRTGTLATLHGTDDDRYEKEIDALCAMIDKGLELGIISSGLNMGSLSLNSLSPDNIKSLSNCLNSVDVICDALPNQISDFVATTGIQKYNTIKVNSVDTVFANYYIGQENMRDGGIESIHVFSSAVYNEGSYLKFDGAGSTNMSEFILQSGKFAAMMEFIDTPNGFYASDKYTGTGSSNIELTTAVSTTGDYDFTSRDVFFYNVSAFSVAGNTVRLGSYLGAGDSLLLDLKGSKATFDSIAKTKEAYASEETNIMSSVSDIGAVYLALNSYSSVPGSLPRHLAELECLASSDTTIEKTNSLLSKFNGSTSGSHAIAARYSAGLLTDPLTHASTYINGDSYYTSVIDSTPFPKPSSYMDGGSVRVRATYDTAAALNDLTLYGNMEDEDVTNAYKAFITLTKEIGFVSLTSSHTIDMTSVNNAFSGIDSAASSSSSANALSKLLYLSSTYDYLLNRTKFHGAYLTLPEVDVPNPFVSGFTFSGLSTYLA